MNFSILVLVKRGFIQEPEVFFDSIKAKKRKKDLLKDFNPDYDEIEIFEKKLSVDY